MESTKPNDRGQREPVDCSYDDFDDYDYHDDVHESIEVEESQKLVRRATEKKNPLKSARFKFHEDVLADATLSRATGAIRLAGYIMHEFEPKDDRSFSFSLRKAAKYLKASRQSVQKWRAQLVSRKHLYRLDTRTNAKGELNDEGRYSFKKT